MNNKPIIALDFSSEAEVIQFLNHFNEPLFVKIGMELYLQEGPTIVGKVKELGHDVFLDLKLHDIPNTVKSAMKGLARLGVDLVNVHAAGGINMMEGALEGLEAGTPAGASRARLIAVTQLTSTTEQQMHEQQKIQLPLIESVLQYARITKQAGLDGVVCSVHEAALIGETCGEDFLRVTPGIRLAGGESHDQKRVATPDFARTNGSSLIVVGRAITKAGDPVSAYKTVAKLWGKTNMSLQKNIAHAMLKVGAVELNATNLFTWASGIQSPIYCDTRLTISDPTARKEIANGLAQNIKEFFPETEVVAGTATAGIPHAAWVSDILDLPMVYVRSKAKEHGRGNQIEGKISAGQKVVVVEDIISTGGSSITAVEALRNAGCEVVGVVCVYTYNLPRAEKAFNEIGVNYVSLTNFDYLIEAATETGTISENQVPFLKEWHADLKAGTLPTGK